MNEFGTIISGLTNVAGYDAEGAVSPDGQKIVFTSLRTGDPEIWIMNSDGTNAKQVLIFHFLQSYLIKLLSSPPPPPFYIFPKIIEIVIIHSKL